MQTGLPDRVKLEFADATVVEIPLSLAKKLRTIYDQIEDVGAELPSPIPLVSREVFSYIERYSDIEDNIPPSFFFNNTQQRPDEIARFFSDIQASYLPPLDTETGLPKPRNTIVFEIILAANYLNYNLPKLESGKFQRNALLQEACREIALQIKGKAPDELKKHFAIKSTFTPEQAAEMRKEFA